jgi:UPF0716 family protein affecting phage T7 exclusion
MGIAVVVVLMVMAAVLGVQLVLAAGVRGDAAVERDGGC